MTFTLEKPMLLRVDLGTESSPAEASVAMLATSAMAAHKVQNFFIDVVLSNECSTASAMSDRVPSPRAKRYGDWEDFGSPKLALFRRPNGSLLTLRSSQSQRVMTVIRTVNSLVRFFTTLFIFPTTPRR